jgi:N-methylhydantoinase B
MFVRPDKILYPAPGIAGGRPGSRGALLLNGRQAPLGTLTLRSGDVLELRLPGGGGLGRPAQRAKHLIARDLQEGYTTRRARTGA